MIENDKEERKSYRDGSLKGSRFIVQLNINEVPLRLILVSHGVISISPLSFISQQIGTNETERVGVHLFGAPTLKGG